MRKRSSRDIRSESRLDVLQTLLASQQSTRNELARATGLSLATVATVVSELIAEGLVLEAGLSHTGTGRPTTTLRINRDRGYLAGIDVAETYVSVYIFDAALRQVGSAEVGLDDNDASVERAVDEIVRTLRAAAGEAGIDTTALLGVGIATPGLVRGHAGWRSIVSGLGPADGERVLALLREKVGLPLVVENPLKAIATAELWLGRGRDASSMVTINLGTGVGAGIVLQGQVLRGFTNSAGEWGHSLLVHDGRGCRCGRRGCVEAYVGVPGIQQTLREISDSHPLAHETHQSDFISELAALSSGPDPDPVATETIERTARYLGGAIADLVAIINPELVMLTGWTTWALADQLLPNTTEELLRQSPRGAADDVTVGVSTVRGNSVAIGVATLAFERFLGDVGLVTLRRPIAL